MNSEQFAHTWIDDWNSHDIERILNHYTENFSITTPMIKLTLGDNTGTLYGKQTIKSYWKKALERFPDLHFELLDIAAGVDSVVLYYKSVLDKKAMEVMFFDKQGKIYKVIAHYSPTNLVD